MEVGVKAASARRVAQRWISASEREAALFEVPPKMLADSIEKAQRLWGEGLLEWAQNQKVELAQRRKAAEAYPKSRRTFMGSLKEDLDYFAKEMDKIEEGTRKHPDQVNETWFEAPYFLDDNVEVPPPGKAWKEGSVHLRPLSAAERKTHRVTGPHFFYFDDPENRFDPFQGKYPRFDPDHETPMSRAEALREAGSLQKEGLEWVDSIIETDIGWEEEKLGEVVAFAKKFASKPAKKDMESAYIDFDFTGWRYLGGLDPTLAKQRLLDKMGDPKARLALSVRYVPFPDNRLGEWSVSGWWLKVYSREFSSKVDQMKENVREVARTTRHEMQHFAQDALRVIKLLSEEAGLPRRRVRHLEDVGAGGEPLSPQAPWPMEEGDSRIKHELRDVEFVTRLADEVDTFLSLVDMDDDDTAKIPAQHWADFIKVFTAAKQIPSPKPEDQYGSWRKYPGWYASHWFNYLKQNDRPRWQEATSKLVDELGRRGVLRKIQRSKKWVPVVEPRHDAWGQSVAAFARDNKGKPWAQAKRDYERLIDSLNTEQLVRHKQLVEETGDREYWVTPRWQGWDGESELPWHGGNVPDHPKLPKKYR